MLTVARFNFHTIISICLCSTVLLYWELNLWYMALHDVEMALLTLFKICNNSNIALGILLLIEFPIRTQNAFCVTAFFAVPKD
ncbi:hypothetical protein M434DRAFT_310304 [Hypoxylon sp. CO27-5]|nr:hypothetical protein M434DRAFT_310304 [Hypoxylon sp. CO27-5]